MQKDFSNPRFVAYNIVYEVMFKNGFSNLLLQKSMNALSDQDKGLVTNIVYGTIQNFDLLKYQLEQVKYTKINNKQLTIILTALYQKHFLDKIPDYAIIDQADIVCQMVLDYNTKKFVISVLKQLLDKELAHSNGNDKDLNLSINYSHPLWFIKMIKKQYGEEALINILKSNHEIAKTHLRYNIMSDSLEEVLKNPLITRSNVVKNGLYYDAPNVGSLDVYLKGYVSIQDFSSQLVGVIANPKPGMKVLDMCAAPGTKTMQMAELMNNEGIIHAYDIYAHKIDLIRANAKRLNVKIVKTFVHDATMLDAVEKEASFDLILCDAVCTGLGVIKRKPEIKYQNISRSMDEIMDVQQKLLEQAYRLLKPNGILVYSTCTINKKENEYMIQQFMDEFKDMELENQIQILGYEQDGDGFYIARLIKKD